MSVLSEFNYQKKNNKWKGNKLILYRSYPFKIFFSQSQSFLLSLTREDHAPAHRGAAIYSHSQEEFTIRWETRVLHIKMTQFSCAS